MCVFKNKFKGAFSTSTVDDDDDEQLAVNIMNFHIEK
jgi:hypothetical protein